MGDSGGLFGDFTGIGENPGDVFQHQADRIDSVLGSSPSGEGGLNLAPTIINGLIGYGSSGLLNTGVVDNLFTGNEGDALIGAAEGYGTSYLQGGGGGVGDGVDPGTGGTNLFEGDTSGNFSNVGGGGIDTGITPGVTDPGAGGTNLFAGDVPGNFSNVGGGGLVDPNTPGSFIPTNSADPTPMTPQLAQQFGIAPMDAGATPGMDPGTGGTNLFAGDTPGDFSNVGGGGAGLPGGSTTGGDNDFLKWLGKHKTTAGLLGISALNAFKTPKLPGAARTAMDSANAGIGQANQTISTGGMGPQWQQQKATIDASIDQQMRQMTEQMMQSAVNSGMGSSSAVTAQKIQQMKAQLETQRQQLYMQAQQQNVQNALRVLTGDNQVLMGIANMQMRNSAESRQAASETAELALLLSGLG